MMWHLVLWQSMCLKEGTENVWVRRFYIREIGRIFDSAEENLIKLTSTSGGTLALWAFVLKVGPLCIDFRILVLHWMVCVFF